MLRVPAAVFAIVFSLAGAWCLFESLFALEPSGLRAAILLGFALLLIATLLWWICAEGSSPEVLRRSLHIVVGGAIGAAVVIVLSALPHFRERSLRLAFGHFLFNAIFHEGPFGFIIGAYFGFLYSLLRMSRNRLTNR